MHKNGYAYVDVSPKNFMHHKDSDTIYVVDCGLVFKIEHQENKFRKLNFQRNSYYLTGFNGTPLFASSSVLRGSKYETCHDLEALGWMLLYLSVSILFCDK